MTGPDWSLQVDEAGDGGGGISSDMELPPTPKESPTVVAVGGSTSVRIEAVALGKAG